MILVTRPMPWAKHLFDLLDAHQLSYQYWPAGIIDAISCEPPSGPIGNTLFLSQSGVLFAPNDLPIEQLFAVGPKTAQAVMDKYQHHCHQPMPGHYSVAGLLEDQFFLDAIKKNPNLRVIGGMHTDITRFQGCHANVSFMPVYTLNPPQETPEFNLPKHGEIWFTSQTLMQFFYTHYIRTLKQKNLLSYDLVVPTMRCQTEAQKMGLKGKIGVVADPRDESFLAYYQVKQRGR